MLSFRIQFLSFASTFLIDFFFLLFFASTSHDSEHRNATEWNCFVMQDNHCTRFHRVRDDRIRSHTPTFTCRSLASSILTAKLLIGRHICQSPKTSFFVSRIEFMNWNCFRCAIRYDWAWALLVDYILTARIVGRNYNRNILIFVNNLAISIRKVKGKYDREFLAHIAACERHRIINVICSINIRPISFRFGLFGLISHFQMRDGNKRPASDLVHLFRHFFIVKRPLCGKLNGIFNNKWIA